MTDSILMWTYFWNIIINSFLSLITLFLFVEFLLFVTRIKSERIKTYCRALPLLKLPFDLLFYDFSSWALLYGFNPWTAAPGTRMLRLVFTLPDFSNPFLPLLTRFQFFHQSNTTFTLADLLALKMSHEWLKMIVMFVVVISLIYISFHFISYLYSRNKLTKILKKAKKSSIAISNLNIMKAMYQNKVKILVSGKDHSPFASTLKENIIVFPKKLLPHLSQEEYEAILGHELEHFCWHDSFLKMCLKVITALFWWIPTKFLLRRIELNQEQSCDHATSRYGIDRLHLASAMTKVLRLQMHSVDMPMTSCMISKSSNMKRLKALLQTPKKTSTFLKWMQICLISFFMTALFWGKFWIF